jgi:hypothetical protein
MQHFSRLNTRTFTLRLLPGEWYKQIPAGYEIADIFGEREEFAPGITDDDIRFGCLSFGILVEYNKPQEP